MPFYVGGEKESKRPTVDDQLTLGLDFVFPQGHRERKSEEVEEEVESKARGETGGYFRFQFISVHKLVWPSPSNQIYNRNY